MVEFQHFQHYGPIPEESIQQFSGTAPAGTEELWRTYGRGAIGEKGFIRLVDPAYGNQMLQGVLNLPEDTVVLAVTGMADVIIVLPTGLWAVVKFRWLAIDPLPDNIGIEGFAAFAEREHILEGFYEWDLYPQAVERDGIPPENHTFGYVPLLAAGGRHDVEHMKMMKVWEHMMLNVHIAGPPKLRE